MDPHRQAMIWGSAESCYRTPREAAAKLVSTFGCTIDLAATVENAVCRNGYGEPRWLGPGSEVAEDALQTDWAQLPPDYSGSAPQFHRIGFLNPPYSLKEIKELKEQAQFREIPNFQARCDALRIEKWAEKACNESLKGFSTIGIFPYSPQTEWFRTYVMGLTPQGEWWGHAALDCWRSPHRWSFLNPDGTPTNNAGVNTCVVHWGPNPGFVGPWRPSERYWSYR